MSSFAADAVVPEKKALSSRRALPLLYGVTIFVSACLLFLVQPLISKLILPWFGGSAAVWVTCMLFFQAGLLLGYSYAHELSRRVSPKLQAFIHVLLLTGSLALLPIVPNPAWQPAPGRGSYLATARCSGGHGGIAVLAVILHKSVAASLVRPERRGATPIPLFRFIERRVAGCADQLPHLDRAAHGWPLPSRAVVQCFRGLRMPLCRNRRAVYPSACGTGDYGRVRRTGVIDSSKAELHASAMPLGGGVCLAFGGDEPSDPEHCAYASGLGFAAFGVPAHLYLVF